MFNKNARIIDENLIANYPKLDKNAKFNFECKPGIECFNKCCNDVNIFLTPYDIARLRKALGISSSEFLSKYTVLPIAPNLRHPIVMLKMDEKTLNCPFLEENGCSVYNDRPWSCRMFPVGIASPNEAEKLNNGDEFYFLIKEDVCLGFEQGREWTIDEWFEDQGLKNYQELGELFKEISLHKFFLTAKAIEPVKLEMFYMVCYDIDKFRNFLFESTFFKRFDVEKERMQKIKTDDAELIKFGFEWLRFSIFGEKIFHLRKDYLDEEKVKVK